MQPDSPAHLCYSPKETQPWRLQAFAIFASTLTAAVFSAGGRWEEEAAQKLGDWLICLIWNYTMCITAALALNAAPERTKGWVGGCAGGDEEEEHHLRKRVAAPKPPKVRWDTTRLRTWLEGAAVAAVCQTSVRLSPSLSPSAASTWNSFHPTVGDSRSAKMSLLCMKNVRTVHTPPAPAHAHLGRGATHWERCSQRCRFFHDYPRRAEGALALCPWSDQPSATSSSSPICSILPHLLFALFKASNRLEISTPSRRFAFGWSFLLFLILSIRKLSSDHDHTLNLPNWTWF